MRALIIAALALAGPAAASASCIAIVGTGQVGGALGSRFAGLGHEVVYGSRTPDVARVRELVAATGGKSRAATPGDAAQACPLVVLAVPFEALETTVKALGSLAGKLVVDVTNPLDVRDGRVVALPIAQSGAEFLESLAPDARIVKAFNTLNYRVMANPSIAGGPVSVPIAGDDAEAKSQLAELVRGLGLEPVDVGPLESARYTESMAMLYVSLLLRDGPVYEFYLRPREPR